jgi:uncharacterized protein (UPF0332 family)
VSDPSELLSVARFLLAEGATSPPTQAQLHRAVSTAYYAVFHKILSAAAERFAGPRHEHTGAYAMLYRSFDHMHMRTMCNELRLPVLRNRIKTPLRRDAVSQDARDFASGFSGLQQARHLADYDPTVELNSSYVSSQIDAAEYTIDAFDRIGPDEQADVLALLMVRTRT